MPDLDTQLRIQREKIARELHDGIGSQLTHIISRLGMLAHRHQSLREPISTLRDLTSETLNQLRETIWLLNQPDLTFGQLAERIR